MNSGTYGRNYSPTPPFSLDKQFQVQRKKNFSKRNLIYLKAGLMSRLGEYWIEYYVPTVALLPTLPPAV